MVETSELLRASVFEGIPDDQVSWFISKSQEITLEEGDVAWRDGEEADAMFIILDGDLQLRGDVNGELVIRGGQPGDVLGMLPFSRMKRFPYTGRAAMRSRILRFSTSLFPEFVQRMPEVVTRLVALMSDRVREVTRIEQQIDRLVALGKLSAGLAHEINNPASSAKRGASRLREMVKQIR